MTRINCIDPTLLLDEHLAAACREGLRPINEFRAGKDNTHKAPSRYRLGTGHVLFMRKHAIFTHRQFTRAREEWKRRGFSGFDWESDITDLPSKVLNDYSPSKTDKRHNLARICHRWRANPSKYHLNGEPVDTVSKFRKYLKFVKISLNV